MTPELDDGQLNSVRPLRRQHKEGQSACSVHLLGCAGSRVRIAVGHLPGVRDMLAPMSRETTPVGAPVAPAGILAEFVRVAGRYQIWLSLSTSREFEVAEPNSALPATFLEPGDLGLIVYSGATAILRSIAVAPGETGANMASKPTAWVRAALAELGCSAPVEALETLAVTRMAASLHAPDRRVLAESIGEACARLDRHRRSSVTSRSPRTR